jgi:hypothetical protein
MTHKTHLYYHCSQLAELIDLAANSTLNITTVDFDNTLSEYLDVLRDYAEDKIEHMLGTGVDKTQSYEYELNDTYPGILIHCQEISQRLCTLLFCLKKSNIIQTDNKCIFVKIKHSNGMPNSIILELWSPYGSTHDRSQLQV